MNRRNLLGKLLVIFILVVFQIYTLAFIHGWSSWQEVAELEDNIEFFRKMDLSSFSWDKSGDSSKKKWNESVFHFLRGEKEVPPVLWNKMLHSKKLLEYTENYYKVLADIRCFPVMAEGLSFEDSWGEGRNFGGSRHHEGCDIMSDQKKAGYYQIVSMTDGTVDKIGWLKLGGYRIGIRSPSGAYFYYAHLDSYADLKEGDKVASGQFLGYMGDSGYGEKGTRGKFPVHLHVGIYTSRKGEEISVNPYYILKQLS